MANEYLTAAIYGMKRFNEGIKRIINMEKLDELLKEFQLEKGERVRLAGPDVEVNDKEELVLEATLISKKYGFIKWLVENDKIEYRKIIEKEIEVGFKLVRIKDYPNKIMEEDVEELLMLLSIQDNPIEFLVSILK